MRRIASLAHLSRSHGLIAALALSACADETVPADESESSADGGINTLSSTVSDASSDTTMSMPTTDPTADTTAGTSSMPTCDDVQQNGDETDVDCGGSCDPCGDGAGCMSGDDCQSLSCDGGECQSPTCYDEVQNGNEDGVDCGTTCPNPCGDQTECTDDDDCRPGQFCTGKGTCAMSSCENDILDTHETDVDCGGIDCPDCGAGADCNVNSDCDSDICDQLVGTCAAPACDDGEQNGDETDQDCGGSCPACPNSDSCLVNSDCQSGICEDENCEAPGCNDGVQNGDETAEDCGGQCGPCDDGEGCVDGGDCVSQVCTDMVCAVPTCNDGELNGDETDEDCGGMCGATCSTGEDCFDGGDCIQGVCSQFGACSAPACNDGVENGDETDLDCGGACGATCDVGEDCIDGGDCDPGVCEMNLCSAPDCFDGIENGDETDVDCGSSCGATCDTGEQCIDDDDCISDVCTANTCQAPTCVDDVQNGNEEGIDCEGTCPDPCDLDGEVQCNTYDADSQLAPAIGAAPDGSFFVVVWTSTPAGVSQDGSGAGIYGQRFDANGDPVGNEFLVNTTTNGNQTNPSVSAWNDGFVVTWESNDADLGGVYAKRYDDQGAVVTAEFQVNSNSTGIQRRPDVAMDNGGAFVICFEHRPVATYDILCRRYNNNAVAQGEQTVNATLAGDQQLPSVGRTNAGGFVVTWQAANDQDGNLIGVYYARFDNAGAVQTAETLVNQTTMGNQSQPSIGVNASGEFVIAWSSDNVDGSSTGIAARRYSSAGAALGGEFDVNTFTNGAQNNPAVALNADGDTLISWVSANQDGNLTGVYAQRYDQDGAAVGVEFRVNTTTTNFQEEPDVVMRAPDEPIVAFSSGSAADRDVFFRRFTANFP